MEWKTLIYPGIDLSGKYLISNTGQIYSSKTKKILKQTLNKSTGYYGICISNGGRKKKKMIKTHIAVAMTFVGGYKKGLVVNHIDGNKTNNYYTNLEWVTNQENTIHAHKMGLFPSSPKLRCVNTGEIFVSISEASRWCGLSECSSSIRGYLKGKPGRNSAGKHSITGEGLQWELI